ncbi:TIGR03089 family protein [Williamsia sterculiae]|uniref:TIGR03089 family protein n=1 Tax=Williamsia sterculiae TaxID=1344003 RepID=A0A1N7E0E6_9NOCA|nr:TIGR03089 family protein [Williamsia sterculiae]SIR81516.1 TIGR03089 family protein [Williamsia sterculiae]
MTSPGPTVTDALLAPSAHPDPTQPLLTFYDDASGERTELSGLTLANWAAKTANFVRDELGLAPGEAVVVDLPVHWQTAAVLLGVWWAGCEVRTAPDPSAPATFCAASAVEDHADGEVIAVPLDAFAMAVPGLPMGVIDFGSAVRVHGDRFVPSGAGPVALDGSSVTAVLTAAGKAAGSAGLRRGDRVLSTHGWTNAQALIDGLIAVFAAGCSLVQVAHADPTSPGRHAETERVTTTLS